MNLVMSHFTLQQSCILFYEIIQTRVTFYFQVLEFFVIVSKVTIIMKGNNRRSILLQACALLQVFG
jgi:hypothetical protein